MNNGATPAVALSAASQPLTAKAEGRGSTPNTLNVPGAFKAPPQKLAFQCVRVRSGLMLFYPGKAPDTCPVFHVVRDIALAASSHALGPFFERGGHVPHLRPEHATGQAKQEVKLKLKRKTHPASNAIDDRVCSPTSASRSRWGRLASSSASAGIATILQCSRSPRSQPRKTRFKPLVSSRSVLARGCSRDTAVLAT